MAPDGLSARGQRLWDQIAGVPGGLSPTDLVLLEEACRTADRLDRLDALLAEDFDAPGALSQARLQAGALRMLLSALSERAAARPAVPEEPAAPGGGKFDDLAQRRATRRSGTAGL